MDVTAARGVTFQGVAEHTSRKYLIETMGSGAALFDYDNDGRLDLFLVNGAHLSDPTALGTIPQKTGPETWNRLYHQKSDGTFEDVTVKAGLQGAGYGMGVAVGDYDNDGFEDLYVTAYGGNKLYHNNGDGTFTDVTESAGVAGSGWSTGAAWVDLDNDGYLDLVVLRYLDWDFSDIYCGDHREGLRAYCHPDTFRAISPLVFHNDGHGHFTEVSKKIGLAKPAKALGIAIADYDRDGHIDLFIANDSMVEYLYHNKGDGTFEETGLLSQVAVDEDGQTYAGMGVDFADYDNDGFPDLVVDNLANQKYALYHNNHDGSFTYASESMGLSRISMLHSGWGLRLFDFDNDGWKDLFVTRGDVLSRAMPNTTVEQHNTVFRNLGTAGGANGGWEALTAEAGLDASPAARHRGLAFGDLDGDGRIDVVTTSLAHPAEIWMNRSASAGHWLDIALEGTKSNRDGIGARIQVVTKSGSQYNHMTTSVGYASSSCGPVHFGLGADGTAASVVIHWPSGIVQTLKDVRGDRVVSVKETP